MEKNEFENLRRILVNCANVDSPQILFASELVDGLVGTTLMYSSIDSDKIKYIVDSEKPMEEIEKIWLSAKKVGIDKLWTGILFYTDGHNDEVRYLYHDPYKSRMFEKVKEWERKYFPDKKYEPDEDEEKWWEF